MRIVIATGNKDKVEKIEENALELAKSAIDDARAEKEKNIKKLQLILAKHQNK